MKVTLVNKEAVKDFYKQWGIFSCECYDTPEKYAENVGKKCHKTKHYSGSRAFYFIFKLQDIPRSAIDQIVRHEQGFIKNVKSQRYTDSSDLGWYVPGWYVPDIIKKHPELLELWEEGFEEDREAYKILVKKLEELEGFTGEKAREVARGRLGIDIYSSAVVGLTIEALEHFMHKRLCFRAQEAVRKTAMAMKDELVKYLDLKEYLVPDCKSTGYCPENDKQCSVFKKIILTKEEFDYLLKTPEFKMMIPKIKEEFELEKKKNK